MIWEIHNYSYLDTEEQAKNCLGGYDVMTYLWQCDIPCDIMP